MSNFIVILMAKVIKIYEYCNIFSIFLSNIYNRFPYFENQDQNKQFNKKLWENEFAIHKENIRQFVATIIDIFEV